MKLEKKKEQEYINKNGLCSICKTSYVDCERMQSNFRCYPKGSSCKGNLVIKCPKFTKQRGEKYQLESPDINTVINYCKDLCANDKIEVYDFGGKKDLVLHIYKDEDFDQKTKAYNLVTISTFRNGKAVDDTGDIHVSELDAELERINSYEDFGIL